MISGFRYPSVCRRKARRSWCCADSSARPTSISSRMSDTTSAAICGTMAVRNTGSRCRKCRRRKADGDGDAARRSDFRHNDWFGSDRLPAGEGNAPVVHLHPAGARQLYHFDACLRRNGCAFGVVGRMTMAVIGLLCLLAAVVCAACAFINKE